MAPSRRQLLASMAAGSIALAGCSGGGDGGDGGGDGSDGGDGGGDGGGTTTMDGDGGGSAATTVTMVNTTFDPVVAEVAVGATVEWVNDDGFGHDVTATQFHDSAADWSFSESLSGGASTEHTFDAAGVYEYYCTIHGESQMCGAVVVGDASLDGSLPCEDGGGGGGGPYGLNSP